MLESITIKFGTEAEPSTLDLDLSNITIFVGPNNSGKSLILREIESHIISSQPHTKILDNIQAKPINIDEVHSFLDKSGRQSSSNLGHVYLTRFNVINNQPETQEFHKDSYYQSIQQHPSHLMQHYLKYFLLRLDGSTRFQLTQPRPMADLQDTPNSHLMSLFLDDESRLKIRELIADAFGLYFVIDPTSLGHFKIKLSKRPPANTNEEQGLDAKARLFHKDAIDINDLSDGVKAYTGLLSAVFSSDYKIILIDEPEAFLHPPLARKLGKCLSDITPIRDANLIVATHSSDFILGCVQSGRSINIVRLTYHNEVSTAKVLPSDVLLSMMRDPLLRSTGVISSLFHEAVIITESDTDRAFYQEINERLNVFEKRGVNGALFLNAQNKQTIFRIMGPLKELGIPTAAIVDIDVIKEGGTVWSNLLRSAQVPEALIESLNMLRAKVKSYFEVTSQDMKRHGGVALLKSNEKAVCTSLFNQLAAFGIFVVPNGELESWLKELGVNGHGPGWLMPIFEKMGSNPDEKNFLKPSPKDVWSFIESVSRYLGSK